MRAKVLTLGLICFFILSCDKKIKNPYSPESPTILNLPTIVSFTATNPERGRYFTISWEVLNATSVHLTITGGTEGYDGDVGLTGAMEIEVWRFSPWESGAATCTLDAENNDGKTQEVIEIEPITAILEITTIPEVPIFTYYSLPDGRSEWHSYFTVAITETNGIGGKKEGQVAIYLTRHECSSPIKRYEILGFEPFGTIEIPVDISTPELPVPYPGCEQDYMTLAIFVIDNNEYWIQFYVDVPIAKEEN